MNLVTWTFGQFAFHLFCTITHFSSVFSLDLNKPSFDSFTTCYTTTTPLTPLVGSTTERVGEMVLVAGFVFEASDTWCTTYTSIEY